MERMTTNEMLKVIMAYNNGANIEYIELNDSDGVWLNAPTPSWNFAHKAYRVKPEPKRIPYDMDDFIKLMKNKTPICNKITGNYQCIDFVGQHSVILSSGSTCNFSSVIKHYVLADNKPLTKPLT